MTDDPRNTARVCNIDTSEIAPFDAFDMLMALAWSEASTEKQALDVAEYINAEVDRHSEGGWPVRDAAAETEDG